MIITFLISRSVNHHPQAIENAIEDAKIPFVRPTYCLVFAHRSPHFATEALVVVYLLEKDDIDASTRISIVKSISKAVLTFCGIRPFKIISLNAEQLQKSSLGKISRTKLRQAFESGAFDSRISSDEEAITNAEEHFKPAVTRAQKAILDSYHDVFGVSSAKIGINNDLFQLGLASIDLLRMKMHLQKRLQIKDVPITTFFLRSSIKDMGNFLEQLEEKDGGASKKPAYDPIVVLQPNGDKTPLFLFHPGLGDVLTFMNLARYITDRPVYGVRARGFDGEEFFENFEEAVKVYHDGIKRVQPKGPYALAGYSFGSFFAFEITKILTAAGESVKFLASFDQAPFTRERASKYDWYECCLSISFFTGLLKEDYAYSILPVMKELSKQEVLNHIFKLAPKARIEEFGMTKDKLAHWAELALNFKTITKDRDPEPSVEHMDIFYTEPLIGLVKARNMKEWFDDSISRWDEVVDKPEYHEVPGGHRNMINPPYLVNFQKKFQKVMEDRGI